MTPFITTRSSTVLHGVRLAFMSETTETRFYTTLRLDKGAVEAFIGNPLACDSPDLWVTLIEADGKHLLAELHNPTEKPIKTRIRKNTGFDLGPPLDRKLTVPAGQSVKVEVSNGKN